MLWNETEAVGDTEVAPQVDASPTQAGQEDAEKSAIAQAEQEHKPTALERIPHSENGEPLFEQAENPEVAWDALVEFSDGNAATAKEIADAMTEEKRKALEKARKLKLKGKTPAEMLASKQANAAELAKAESEYNHWQRMANVEQNRQNAIRAQQEAEARQRATERAEAEKAKREAREEAERREREALEGIPEWHMDTPENARKRGARRYGGQIFTRQEPVNGVVGKEVEVKFSQKDLPKGHVVVMEAEQLQPSHIQGKRNPMFFIEEAQPKNRAEDVSQTAARNIAENIRPQEVTSSTTAYTGAPTINTRGEVIQGNNRSDALRYLWQNNLPEQQQAYKQYLLDQAEQLGLDSNAINAMQHPVLVNQLDVDDAEAIRLGQMTAQDTESGGVERIKPKNVAQKLGDNMRTFANRLLSSSDNDATFGQLVDRNGEDVLNWMNQIGAISNTQYQSAFDSKGKLTPEAKNDLQKVLYQAVFKGGSQQLEEMFDRLPAKAQRAILSTAFRDMDSPFAGKMLSEIQSSIIAYNALMQDEGFASAKNMEEVLRAIEIFKHQTALDDRFEQYMPADNFSNFALHLAGLYKASDMSQTTIASYFNEMYDLAQGKKAATLFEEADTTEYPLAEVIKKVLGIDYKPAKNGNNNVANGGADVALRNQEGQGGQPRSNKPSASGEQNQTRTESSERGEGTDNAIRRAGTEQGSGKWANDNVATREARIREWLSDENLEWAEGKTLDEILEHFGNELQPIAVIPTGYLKYLGDKATDTHVYCGKGYFIDHAVNHHDEEPIEEYLKIQDILDSPTDVKLDTSKGRPTLLFIKQYDKYYVEMVSVGEDGTNRIVLHKSFFHRKKLPHRRLPSVAVEGSSVDEIPTISPASKSEAAGSSEFSALDDIRKSASSEGGTSSISHTETSVPAISLQSRGDAISSEKDEHIDNSPISTDKVTESIPSEQADTQENSTQAAVENKGLKPVRFEAGRRLTKEEKKEVLNTLRDAFKENGVPYHIEESDFGKERRVYEPTSEDWVKSDITGRPLRYYITLPDGRVAHPTELFPNISAREVTGHVNRMALLEKEASELISKQVNGFPSEYIPTAISILEKMQSLPHDVRDMGYGPYFLVSYDYIFNGKHYGNSPLFVSLFAHSVIKESSDAIEATVKAVNNSYYMVDALLSALKEKYKSTQAAVESASAEVETSPTEAQKKAGNYKMGHVKVGAFDVTIENPKGSERSGTDANGKKWSVKMNNTYGYIRGTEGVDGDHIDVFLAEDMDKWDGKYVFVVDQYNPDGTFDEHKVMLGFNSTEEARSAYLSNYEKGWENGRRIVVARIKTDGFQKWVDSSHRKTKPFAHYVIAGAADVSDNEKKPSASKKGKPHVSKENEVKRTVEHFPMETPEEAAAFDKRVPEMKDSELLAYMQEDGKGDINSAYHMNIYDEYDYRHTDEQTEAYNTYIQQLHDSNTTLEQAEEMLGNILGDVERFATDERSQLIGQSDALQDYITELERQKEDERAEAENSAENTDANHVGAADVAENKSAEPVEADKSKQYGEYQEVYDNFVSDVENRGMIPDLRAIKNKIRDTKRRLTVLKNGAATSIQSDEDLKRFETAEKKLTDLLHVYEAMRDYTEARIKKAEAAAQRKPWSEKNAQERMDEASKNPLTEEEIQNAPTDEVNKANALDYLSGNHGLIQSISYLKVYEDVRNPNGSAASDSGTKDKTQLAGRSNSASEGRDTGGKSGGTAGRVDNGGSRENVSEQSDGGKSGERSTRDNAGEGSNTGISTEEQPVGRRDANSGKPRRGGTSGRTRSDGGRSGRGESGNPATENGTRRAASESVKEESADDFLNQALGEFKDVLDDFIKAGRGELSISLVGLNSKQMEILPRLIQVGAKVGYAYIRKGVHGFTEWANHVKEAIGKYLRDANLSDDEIDAFIKEMWKSKIPFDGQIHTLEEWASIYSKKDLRNKVRTTIEEKREAQRQAESISVKTGDINNIRETLPFLLPQQQEDVLRAETQFFDETHQDREHANGKGYMFTNGTGTGKTYTGLGIVKRFVKQGKKRILILTPSQPKVRDWINDGKNLGLEIKSLDDWAKERGTTATTEAGEGTIITTYANFRQNEELLNGTFDLIVYDESHRLMENKNAANTIGTNQHHMIANRDAAFATIRLRKINPFYQERDKVNDEFKEKREQLVKELTQENPNEINGSLVSKGLIPHSTDAFNWHEEDTERFPEFAQLHNRFQELTETIIKEVDPQIEEQAKKDAAHTKVVFLSATPFNTRENIDYAQGYIFSYPDKEQARGYSVASPMTIFFEEHFGAAYKWRYGRLEHSERNAEAIAQQEREFSDWLQHTLCTMSGRIIDSEYDYSRDFPVVSVEHAEEINNAAEEILRDKYFNMAYHKVFGNYNYAGALFETLKVATLIPRIKQHLKAGRKVVIFHRRVESKTPLIPPFAAMLSACHAIIDEMKMKNMPKEEIDAARHRLEELKEKWRGLLKWESMLDYSMPREQIAKAFGADNVLYFSGQESTKEKNQAVDSFNNDESGKNIIVIQEASGKEGISLHDTTGKHQRVLITLALPQSPITALQIEGRIYRIGNRSNAIFEYPLLGLNSEIILFGQKFNGQIGTTENLALGSQARNLRESFARSVEESGKDVPIEEQGFGGKEADAAERDETSPFDRAVLDYYGNQKLKGKRDSREGVDYYPTPEPLGFKMVEWGNLNDGETALEPSAGHGAIARYVPSANPLTAIEPSQNLFAKLQLKAGGSGRKFVNTIFEGYNVVNKHDVIFMNPPFGTGGRLAVDHVAKAFTHLTEGGRIVAIIPRGSTDKKFDKWIDEQENAVVTGEIMLPDITFQQAGTSVMARVLVIDKVTNQSLRSEAESKYRRIDLSRRKYDKIEDFFEDIRDIQMPSRTIDEKARMLKRAAPALRDIKELKGVVDVQAQEDGIDIRTKGSAMGFYLDLTVSDFSLQQQLQTKYQRYAQEIEWNEHRHNEKAVEIYKAYNDLVCRLLGKTAEEVESDITREKMGLEQPHEEKEAAINVASQAEENSSSEQNESTTESSPYHYELKHHTKTGAEMFMAMPNEKSGLSSEEYSSMLAKAKKHGGYWNRFMKGFAFPSEKSAKDFLAETGNTEPQADERYQKAGTPLTPNSAEVALRDAIADLMRKSGLEVLDSKEGQQVLDEANRDELRMSFNDNREYEGKSSKERSDIQYKKAKELLSALHEAGFKGFEISRSITPFGVSTYIQGDLGLKFRISDHGVSSFGRIFGEEHISLNTSSEYVVQLAKDRKKDINAQAEKYKKERAIKEEREKRANEKWNRIKANFEGMVFKRNDRTYQDYDTFSNSISTNRQNGHKYQRRYVMQTAIGKSGADTAYRYEWAEPADVDEYGVATNIGSDRPSLEFIEAYDEADTAPIIREHRVYHGSGIRFFRTSNGEAYGFTVGGKIYIDPRIATAETPIHEYAHLWATAMREGNPTEWKNIVGLMKGTSVWAEVQKLYPELKNDDDIADEVLATFSGRRGAERLRAEQQKIMQGDGSVFEKAAAVGALARVKQALSKFWKGVADFLGIHYTSAEEVADRVMKDLLEGVDPRKFGVSGVLRESIRLPKTEYAKVAHAIATNKGLKNKGINWVFTDNNYYIYTANEDGYFAVEFGLPIRGNENFINELIKGIGNGTIRDTRSLHSVIERERSKPNRNNRNNADAEGRQRSTGRTGNLALRQQTNEARSDERLGSGLYKSPSTRNTDRRAGRETGGVDDNLYRQGEDTPHTATSSESKSQSAQKATENLNLGGRVVVHESAEGLEGKEATAKGWYDTKTGQIHVVLSNNADAADVTQTILHEAVAHHGLRELFGHNVMDAFLDSVLAAASQEVKDAINELRRGKGWNFRTATEEYLAGLAERTDFERMTAEERGLFATIRRLFNRALEFLGLKNHELSDRELAYILWCSYQNLKTGEKGRYVAEAERIAMRYKLKAGKNAMTDTEKKEHSVLLRGELDNLQEILAKDTYERLVTRGSHLERTAWVDMLSPLQDLQHAIEKNGGFKLGDFENPYNAYITMSSRNYAQMDIYKRTLYADMIEAIHALGSETGRSYEEIKTYVMAKHGMERQKYMAGKAAEEAYDRYKSMHPFGQKTLDYFIDEYEEKSFAGLTELFGTQSVSEAMDEAQKYVEEVEAEAGSLTDSMWDSIRAATKSSLQRAYEAGLISKETYDNVSSMYQYYIPLRGFDEATSDEVYEYFGDQTINGGTGSFMKKAKGRKSVADDPFAVIGNMAEMAIMQSNRNLMKQQLLNLALNHPSDLISVSNLYVKFDEDYDNGDGTRGAWVPVAVPDTNGMTTEEANQVMLDFQDDMEEKVKDEPDTYALAHQKPHIPYRVLGRNMNEHQVMVKRGGKTYILTINGNPRAAQAINGLLNPDATENPGAIALKAMTNWIARMATARNVEFAISNAMRDLEFSTTLIPKEGTEYYGRYVKNYLTCVKNIGRLVNRLNGNTLDMSNPLEKAFYDFIYNGGETGYTFMKGVERYKGEITKALSELRAKEGKSKTERLGNKIVYGHHYIINDAWNIYMKGAEYLSRCTEDWVRFAVFLTSRQMGRSMEQSIMDAKEVTVNFNRKGAGSKSAGKWDVSNFFSMNNLHFLSAYAASAFKNFYAFSNASIQGLDKNVRLHLNHTAGMLMWDGAAVTLGMLSAMCIPLMLSAIGGDPDDYWDMPESMRRMGIMLPLGKDGRFLTLPMSIEHRAAYGIGELLGTVVCGSENLPASEISFQAFEQLSQILPLDLTEGNGSMLSLVPTAVRPEVEIAFNKNWLGMPIYKEPFNKNTPAFRNVYQSTNPNYIAMSKWLNEVQGGGDYERAGVQVNPAMVQHLVESYTGGAGKFVSRTSGVIAKIIQGEQIRSNEIPFYRTLVKSVDDRTHNRAARERFQREYDKGQKLIYKIDNYQKESARGNSQYVKELDEFAKSKDFMSYMLWKSYNSVKSQFDNARSYIGDDKDKRAALDHAQMLVQKMMTECARAVEDSKTQEEADEKIGRIQSEYTPQIKETLSKVED